jgi:predicted nuclease of predicted toxin-antitoxin system
MKLLFDENLSPLLAQRLQDIFPGSSHVHDCSLGASDDALVVQVQYMGNTNGSEHR